MSGAPVGLNAPKQAQRKAVKGSQPAPEPIGTAPSTNPSYHAQIAAVYQTLAGYTDDPLVHEYAMLAQQQAGKV
jgi:hypothetical protein